MYCRVARYTGGTMELLLVMLMLQELALLFQLVNLTYSISGSINTKLSAVSVTGSA